MMIFLIAAIINCQAEPVEALSKHDAKRTLSFVLPVIAIIGRPNVGKSTLFNRFIGVRYAITSNIPGTTRDRIYHEAEIGGYRAILVDTGGLEFFNKKGSAARSLEADVQAQARIGALEADLIYFVLDASQPLTASDRDCANFLRKSKKPILVIANKADTKASTDGMSEILELGLGEAVAISAIHNIGIDEMHEASQKILKKMKWKKERHTKSTETKIAIVGKPNVGKSSLLNAMSLQDRAIVSDIAGTTVDTLDTRVRRDNHDFLLIDTAGLRRRGKVKQGIERWSTLRALRAVARSDVVCLVLDFAMGIANQDLHVSEYVLEAGKGLIIIVNKSDLMDDPGEDRKKFLDNLSWRMSYVPWAPVLFTSTITKKNVFQIFELAQNIAAERKKKIPDAELNMFTKTTVAVHLPSRSSHHITISKGIQTGTEPPVITFYTNKPDAIHFSYRRFLENELRRKFGFHGTAIRLEFMKVRE